MHIEMREIYVIVDEFENSVDGEIYDDYNDAVEMLNAYREGEDAMRFLDSLAGRQL